MLKLFLLFGFVFFSFAAISQKSGDKKIIITLSNDSAIYQKVKIALAKHDFVIRDDGKQDTITTLLREFKTMPGYCTLTAIIKNDTVILSGIFGRKKVNVFGYNTMSKEYRPIIYFGDSKSWLLLQNVAKEMGGTLSFSK